MTLATYNKIFYSVLKFILSNSGVRQDAEDVFHDSLLITYSKLKEGLKLTCALDTYIYEVCRRQWLKTLKLRKRKVFPVEEEDAELIEILNKHLDKLNPENRRALLMFYDGAKHSELCECFGYKNRFYAKARKYDFKKKLKESLLKDSEFKELYFEKQC